MDRELWWVVVSVVNLRTCSSMILALWVSTVKAACGEGKNFEKVEKQRVVVAKNGTSKPLNTRVSE